MIYFLVCKNFLLILIELYRIYVIYTEENKKRHEKNEHFKKRFRRDTIRPNQVSSEKSIFNKDKMTMEIKNENLV